MADFKLTQTGQEVQDILDYAETLQDVAAKLVTDVANKVDKVEGKGLSTNDFTNTYKNQLDNEIVGEFTVEGSDYDIGEYADIKGEKFNDYSGDNGNLALAPGTHAEGTRGVAVTIDTSFVIPRINTSVVRNIAGCMCYEIKSGKVGDAYCNPSITINDDRSGVITVNGKVLSDTSTHGSGKLEVGDVVSLVVEDEADDCGRITAIVEEQSSNTTKISVDYIGEKIKTGLTVYSGFPFILKVNEKPLTGAKAIGFGAHTEGIGNKALADGAHAEGRENKASGRYSHTEGYSNIALYGAHAEGRENKALGNYAHAEGYNNTVSGQSAHAEGHTNIASGGQSHAEGHVTTASGLHSHTEGTNTKAINEQSHAEGNSSTASGIAAHAEGYKTIASGKHSHAEGNTAKATGEISHAEGYSTEASSAQSHAEGHSTKAQGDQSHAEGHETIASGAKSHAEGWKTKSQGICSHAGGESSIAAGNCSFVHGNNVKTSKNNQTAFGLFNNNKEDNIFEVGNGTSDTERSNAFEVTTTGVAKASGKTLATEEFVQQEIANIDIPEPENLVGKAITNGGEIFNDYTNNQASGLHSHAEGNNTRASGKCTHSEGMNTTASGEMSHAEGLGSKAIGTQSHAEGHSTQSVGNQSHAEGHETIASGEKSHAEGWKTESYGGCSHAGGMDSKAKGAYSFAQGNNVIAGFANQTVVGLFNDNKSDNLFEVGNGTKDTARSNAFEVTKTGTGKLGGNTILTVSSGQEALLYIGDTQPAATPGKITVWINLSGAVKIIT